MRMFVNCPACRGRHEPGEIEVSNVEEDFDGGDVLAFTCPDTDTEERARVYVQR